MTARERIRYLDKLHASLDAITKLATAIHLESITFSVNMDRAYTALADLNTDPEIVTLREHDDLYTQ